MTKTYELVAQRLKNSGVRFYSDDNIASFIEPEEFDKLIEETTEKFEGVLDALLIDWRNDPNAKGTPKRLAKMYYNETMSGRYTPRPDVAAFPNEGDDRFDGMLTARAEIKTMCSHHHQPVDGVVFISIIPSDKVIGLSKYIRLAQWLARRGTLQEALTKAVVREIVDATGSEDVACYIAARHGCCENRGVMAADSNTQTTVLSGKFKTELSTKQEFLDYVKIYQGGK